MEKDESVEPASKFAPPTAAKVLDDLHVPTIPAGGKSLAQEDVSVQASAARDFQPVQHGGICAVKQPQQQGPEVASKLHQEHLCVAEAPAPELREKSCGGVKTESEALEVEALQQENGHLQEELPTGQLATDAGEGSGAQLLQPPDAVHPELQPNTEGADQQQQPSVLTGIAAPAQRQKRAAATAAAKNLMNFIAEESKSVEDLDEDMEVEEASSQQAAVANGRKRKSPDALLDTTEEAASPSPPADSHATLQPSAQRTAALVEPVGNTGELLTASATGEQTGAHSAGLASLLTEGQPNGTSRASTPKVATSLGDLLWSGKANANGLASLAQPGGLASLALPKANRSAQALKVGSSENPKANGHANGVPAPNTPALMETEEPHAELLADAASKPKGRKGRLVGAKNGVKKAAQETLKAGEPKAEGNPKKVHKRKQGKVDAPADSVPDSPMVEEAENAGKEEVRAEQTKRRGRPAAGGRNPTTGKGRGRGRGHGRGKGRVAREETPASEPEISGDSDLGLSEAEDEEKCDELYGCAGCHWLPQGCSKCRAGSPIMRRPQSVRWKPEEGRYQVGIPEAPTFYPTEEEFADPLTYINKIRIEGEKAGIACIVPPKGWAPPFALDKGTNGQSADSFRFSIRRQPTWQLCMRMANANRSGARKSAAGRYDAKKPDDDDECHVDAAPEDGEGEFGFVTLDRTHTLTSFAEYAKWAKAMHFGIKNGKVDKGSKRRRVNNKSEEPSVEEIEAEIWRIIETPDEVVESLYGQDLDSGHHGSGFPLPPFRKRLLMEHLKATAATRARQEGHKQNCACVSCKGPDELQYTPEEEAYSEHCWNINNLPRCKGSVLRYVIGEELITGVMVPWLYVGSCMSAFCWHIEDHALYSINYLHNGAPKVWYGVPAHASDALDEAMRDALPHLFEAAPDLLYQLVTMLSPMQLRDRGVPVHRLVHHEGSFVITFPNAYHAGFNTGFNCAEAVNFAPPDWLPWGCSILSKYRRDRKAATLSNDALLVALVKGAGAVQGAALRRADMGQGPFIKVLLVVPSSSESVKLQLQIIQAAPKLQDDGNGDVEMGNTERAASGQAASTSGRTAVPGQRADTSYLDPIKVEDAPAEAIRLAAAELALRVQEERRRRDVGLTANSALVTQRMTGKPGEMDELGVHTNTEDIDCMDCKCDLWLSAVVSKKCPGHMYCPEHASQLPCSPQEWILLHRYTLEELDAMLLTAEQCVDGTKEAIAAAMDGKLKPPKVEVKKIGPVKDLILPSPGSAPAPSKKIANTTKHLNLPPATAEPKPAITKKESAAVKKEAAAVKKEAAAVKKEDLLVEDPDEPAELSDTPPPEPRRGRKNRKEEGDWTPPKKRGRGPGRKKLEQEVSEAACTSPEAGVKSEHGSDAEKSAAETDLGPGRGRGRGRSSRGGRGRGRGSKRVAKAEPGAVAEAGPEQAAATTLPAAQPAVQPLVEGQQVLQGTAVSPQIMLQAGAMDPHQAALWAEMQRLMYAQAGYQQAGTQGCNVQPGYGVEQLASLPGVMQQQSLWEAQMAQQNQAGAGSVWQIQQLGCTPYGGQQALPAQQKQTGSQAGGGNSVLMDILRASVQAQPQGSHIAPGSVPLSQAHMPGAQEPGQPGIAARPPQTSASELLQQPEAVESMHTDAAADVEEGKQAGLVQKAAHPRPGSEAGAELGEGLGARPGAETGANFAAEGLGEHVAVQSSEAVANQEGICTTTQKAIQQERMIQVPESERATAGAGLQQCLPAQCTPAAGSDEPVAFTAQPVAQ